MDFTKLYYDKFLAVYVDYYRTAIKQAKAGHCMKITCFAKNELKSLIGLLRPLNQDMRVFILSDELEDVGEDFIRASKLIELRNDNEKPLLVLVPVNNRTSAEDSYGDATFKDLIIDNNVKSQFYRALIDGIPSKHTSIWKSSIEPILDEYKSPIQNRINYLLFQEIEGWKLNAWGEGLFCLDLLPDSKFLANVDNTRRRFLYNLQCTYLLCDFSISISDKVAMLPIAPDTLQSTIVSFFSNEKNLYDQNTICERIYESYPDLYFSNWQIKKLEEQTGNVVVFAELVPGKKPDEELVKDVTNHYVLQIPKDKKSKVKVKMTFDPSPKYLPELQKFQVLLINQDGYVVVNELKNAKLNTTNKSKTVTIAIPWGYCDDGTYFLRVHALDADGIELDKNNPFKPDSVQANWEQQLAEAGELNSEEIRVRKEQFQLENNVLTSNETTFFTIINANEDSEEVEEPVDKRKKCDNMLQAYFNYRIEQIRKGTDVQLPETNEDSEWKVGSLNDVFYFDFGKAVFAYQIQNSKKLLELERGFYKHSTQFGGIYAEISGNPTDIKLQDWKFKALPTELSVPAELINLRYELINLIQTSAASESGIISIFPIYNHIEKVREYVQQYSSWVRSAIEKNPSEDVAVALQNIDMVDLRVEMPDGSHTMIKLITPIHTLRLAWLVNIYDLYQDWENKTIDNSNFQNQWYHNLDKLFMGEIPMEVSPLVLTEGALTIYQYVGELTFGWGMYAIPKEDKEDVFASEFRQMKSYVASLLNISRDRQIDSDVNLDLVFRHIDNYTKSHLYTDKIVINLFNAGDANVFADALVAMEKRNKTYDYEVRMFADDKLIQPGQALRDLLDPDSTQSEAAEKFSLASKNRLFPKLRFSINSIQDFINEHQKYQAHISFLVNPFPVTTEMVRPDAQARSFFLNGIITKSAVAYQEKSKSMMWSRYFSENSLPTPVNEFANESITLFANIQYLIGKILSSTGSHSVPSTCLTLHENDSMLLSFVHDISDWVVTFDKNMGPEFYDLPSGDSGEMPYLLDYIPGQERTGISSFLTTRPTSEIEGLMKPHFERFGITINDSDLFKQLLEDVRTVSSSIVMQTNSTQNKAFEVLGITFTKRMLKKKGLLQESFIIPIDLHKELFENLDTQNKERADNLVVNIDVENRKIQMQVIEIKCRQSLTEQSEEELEGKIVSQIENTIVALKEHFEQHDRLDRELKTMEFANLLSFYIRRAQRYHILDPEVSQEYLGFLDTLGEGYEVEFKRLGIIYNLNQQKKQIKEQWGETIIYKMGLPVIRDILSEDKPLDTISLDADDYEFLGNFPPTRRAERISTRKSDRASVDVVSTSEDIPSVSIGGVVFPEHSVKPDQPVVDVLTNIITSSNVDIAPIETANTENPVSVSTEHTISITQASDAPNSSKTTVAISARPEVDPNYKEPKFGVFVGTEEPTAQFGILGKTIANNRLIGLDLNGCNTFSLFGVQGAGKSYTIGTVTEMVLKQFSNVNKLKSPLASVIFHYSDTMDYAPEFTSMIYPNDEAGQLAKLKDVYGAEAGSIDDIVLLTPESKVEERQSEYPNLEVHPIGFDSSELQVKDWMFLLGAVGNDSTYIKEFKQILKKLGKDISLKNIKHGVVANSFLSNSQKNLANQRINFAEDYVTDGVKLQQYLKPGRLIVVDLRDEYIEKDEALGLFVVMLNIFSGVKLVNGEAFNKFIVFDEAHKYMDDKKLVNSIATAIKEMRHKGVSIMIASQNPIGLPKEIIELSSVILLHRFNSPGWVQHMKSAITALGSLSATEMSSLGSGEAYLWATKASDKTMTIRPVKISVRPRVTKHGGDTIQATQE